MDLGKFDDFGKNVVQINAKKLLDWLVNRRICKHDWRPTLSTIQKKIKLSINQMPENDAIKTILSNSLDYSRCRQIVEILKTTDANTKNIFGRYRSKTMNDWLEIVSLYENNNMFLAEVCNSFSQIVQYDLPSLKSKHAKNLQLINELQKRKQIAVCEANTAADEIKHFCADYFIEYDDRDDDDDGDDGDRNNDCLNFERKLRSSYDLIRNHNREIIVLVQKLQPYVDFYAKFVTKTHHLADHRLPHLQRLIVNGNECELENNNEDNNEDDNDNDNNVRVQIDSNKKNVACDVEEEFVDEIDFGDFEGAAAAAAAADTKDVDGSEKKVSLLDDRKFVYEILTEIKELEIFFEIRTLDEQNSEFVHHYVDKPIDDLQTILTNTRNCTQKILDHKMQIIKQVLSSEKCFRNAVSNYRNKIAKKTKLETKIANFNSQIVELTGTNIELGRRKTELIKNALSLKQKIETQLSDDYLNGQKAQIVGDFR